MTVSEFFHAGGYGFYLWGSFGMTLLLMAGEVIAVKNQRRTILKRLRRMMRLNAAEVDE
ncbi:MAG TPA: heme exporter protein CcmD [Sedimenticola sp.]|nr:heme exporter protein CcmD [Sedimenticola sp.]